MRERAPIKKIQNHLSKYEHYFHLNLSTSYLFPPTFPKFRPRIKLPLKPEKTNHVHPASIILLLNKVLLQLQHHVPHLIIILNVIRVEDVHAFCVLTERPRVVGLLDLLGLVAERAQPGDEADEGVEEEEFAEDQDGDQQIEGKVEL